MKKLLTLITFALGMVFTANAQSCPDGNHPHIIDLGLPSGTRWACCNVGAKKPEDYGGCYAWGETETKSTYDWKTYKFYRNKELVSIGSDIAGTQYDVAHVKWGGTWVMPSESQIKELLDSCHHEMTWVNGVKGIKFTSKSNGMSIFLPNMGGRYSHDLSGSCGYFWSSTPDSEFSRDAVYLYFSSGRAGWFYDLRCNGFAVRPVSK